MKKTFKAFIVALFLLLYLNEEAMSISIYYEAARNIPLTHEEQKLVEDLVIKYSVDLIIKNYLETGIGLNWESFSFYEKTDAPNLILKGSTKLPDNSEDASWIGVQHWCKLLTEIRRTIKNATWQVNVEDHNICWDESNQEYDPTK